MKESGMTRSLILLPLLLLRVALSPARASTR